MITLEQFVASEQLAGSCEAFADLSTWQPWLAFGRAAHGLELDEPSRNLYGRCTRRRDYAPPEGGYREVVAITGRQSGKTRFASALVAFVAATHPPVRDGNLYALLLAQDARAAQRAAFSYVCAIFDASHSAQRPGGHGDSSGGDRAAIPLLVGAAAGAGYDGLFLEVHPDPSHARSDPDTQWPLGEVGPLIDRFLRIRAARIGAS